MSKIREIPLTVWLRGNVPYRLRWENRWARVQEILNAWRETGYWWEGEHEKDFYRLQCDTGQYDIYRDRETNQWFLYRVWE
ncbi:MAG: hypothetical protein QHJ73_09440 [Armatimonadota bacterium]|nr:hypothetical protein [Armatimonadota bacterium]